MEGLGESALAAQAPSNNEEARSYLRFQPDLDDLLAPHDMVWRNRLPSNWREGAPLGNGDFGVLISGEPDNLSLSFAKSDVWDERNDDRSVFPGSNFRELRDCYVGGDWQRFQALTQEAAALRRNQTLQLPHLTTCGQIKLHLDVGRRPEKAELRVRLRDGVVELKYLDRRVEVLISRSHHVVMLDFDRGATPQAGPAPMNNRYGAQDPAPAIGWELSRPPSDGNSPAEFSSADGIHFLTQRFAAGGHYTLAFLVDGGVDERAELFSKTLRGEAQLGANRRIRLFATVVSSQDNRDTVGESRARLIAARNAGVAAIQSRHREWWTRYWGQGLASVDDREVEKWYYVSLYLCGAMLEPGRRSPGLQGVWCGEDFPRWCADYHSNGNIQAVYWGLAANNRLEWMEPYLTHYYRTAGVARKIAREYYGVRGLRFPHMGSPAGNELNPPNQLMVDVCGTGWILRLFWKYYQYSQDITFLRERAYPLLRDGALFYADLLVRDSASGQWTLTPTLHFEARTYSESRKPQASPPFDMWGRNSLYSQAILRMTFAQAIEASQALGVDAELRKLWTDRLQNLQPPPVTDEGYWKAWDDHDPVYGWHNYHLPLIFPGEVVSRFHGPPEFLEQARRTWRHIKSHNHATNSGKAWCGGHGVCELIGLGEVDEAFRNARWSEAQQTNGLTVFPETPVLQADHGPGMCRVLPDMVVQEFGGVLRFFPGIPPRTAARFYSLRVPGAFLVSGEKRGRAVDYVVVQPMIDRELVFANPWSSECAVMDAQTRRTLFRGADPVIRLQVARGRTYQIIPASKPVQTLGETNMSFSTWVKHDLEYASPGAKPLLLDLYMPRIGAELPPLVVSIHGGGWHGGDKEGTPGLQLTRHGFAVASINYRLTGEATFPAQIHDCKAAVRWLRRHAGLYGYRAERIGVWGASAGGHLAALLGTSSGVEDLEGSQGNREQSSSVQAVVDFFGPTDVEVWARHKNQTESNLIPGPFSQTSEPLRRANPITFIGKSAPPFFIAHGEADTLVPVSQSKLLHEALQRAGVESTLTMVPGAGHSVQAVGLEDEVVAFFRAQLM